MEGQIAKDDFEKTLLAQFTTISLSGLRAMFLQVVTSTFNEKISNKSYAFKAEIKQIKNQSYNGIYYVQLQDADVTISAMVPEEMAANMQEGDSGIFCGIFMARTNGDQATKFDTMLFRVTFFQRQGIGELYEAKENLRVRLQQEGLLNREPKPFPGIPERGLNIVIVSNQRAKGYSDITTSLRQHASIRVALKPCNLMNSEDIVRAIEDADQTSADVLIVARGGGDGLGIFDREEVVRAIAGCETYTISAIGHADDTTLANEVSDYAVITPTMAATYIVDRMREHEVNLERKRQAEERRKEHELTEKRFKEVLDNQAKSQKMLENKDAELKELRKQLLKEHEEAEKKLKQQREMFEKAQKEQNNGKDQSNNKAMEALTKELTQLREQLQQVTKLLEKTESEKKAALEQAKRLEKELQKKQQTPVPVPVPTPAPAREPAQRRPAKKNGFPSGVGVWVVVAIAGILLMVWALH